MNRHDAIRQQLDFLVSTGILTDWTAASPGGKAKKWSIMRGGAFSLYLSTREVELWLSGAMTAQRVIADKFGQGIFLLKADDRKENILAG